MSHRPRSFLLGTITVGLMIAVPVVAWAAPAHVYSFDATKLGNQRLPSAPRADFAAPAVKQARMTSDIQGTACDSAYSVQLVRNRDYLPDDVISRYDKGRACDEPVSQSDISWSSGRFHFDARVNQRQEPQFGAGYVKAQW